MTVTNGVNRQETWISNQIRALELQSDGVKHRAKEIEQRLEWYRELESELRKLDKERVFG